MARYVAIRGLARRDFINELRALLAPSERAEKGLADFAELADLLDALGVTEQEDVFDCSLMRGLDYYTAMVFEASMPNAQQFGSVLGGGRYDGLVDRFSETSVPACGVSIGLDRFIDALTQLGKLRAASTTTQTLIIAMKGVPEFELMRLAAELRQAGIRTEVYTGMEGASMKDQLAFANAKGVPLAVIVGEDEIKSGTVSIKNLVIGKEARAGVTDHVEYKKQARAGQFTAQRTNLVTTVKEQLGL